MTTDTITKETIKSIFFIDSEAKRSAIMNAARTLFFGSLGALLFSGKFWWAGPLGVLLMLAMGSWLFVRCALDDAAKRFYGN